MSRLSTEDKNRLIDVLRSSIMTAESAAARLLESEPDFKQLQEIRVHLRECIELGNQRPTRTQRPPALTGGADPERLDMPVTNANALSWLKQCGLPTDLSAAKMSELAGILQQYRDTTDLFVEGTWIARWLRDHVMSHFSVAFVGNWLDKAATQPQTHQAQTRPRD